MRAAAAAAPPHPTADHVALPQAEATEPDSDQHDDVDRTTHPLAPSSRYLVDRSFLGDAALQQPAVQTVRGVQTALAGPAPPLPSMVLPPAMQALPHTSNTQELCLVVAG